MWRSHCSLLLLFPSIVAHNYCNLICVLFPRWLCYCHVPQSNDSLPRYETTQVFGRSLLKSIFTVTRRQLLEKFRVEKDKLLPEKRTLILTHFPKYVVCNQSVVIRSGIKVDTYCGFSLELQSNQDSGVSEMDAVYLWLVTKGLCPRFLSMLEEEIYGDNSPIWEADFTMPASEGGQLGHQLGEGPLSSN